MFERTDTVKTKRRSTSLSASASKVQIRSNDDHLGELRIGSHHVEAVAIFLVIVEFAAVCRLIVKHDPMFDAEVQLRFVGLLPFEEGLIVSLQPHTVDHRELCAVGKRRMRFLEQIGQRALDVAHVLDASMRRLVAAAVLQDLPEIDRALDIVETVDVDGGAHLM
eukprot:CAMPEP_0197034048 /NCGR_PEP_ID=MMETSP1384-20130603/12266_1 /TAXON_ID=29189 /ORGANISM="Ammonia sp." /LENGTH=164 /DNA_ID=CAMNT_0042463923 /DNA_START=87 /DNA_END=581 /DNA_ORIENTATION=+